MKEIVFNSEQKEILLDFLKRKLGTEFDKPIYHQMYKAFKENNKYFFTPTWSRNCYIAVSDGYQIFQKEYELWEDYIFQTIIGRSVVKPNLSKKFEFWKDLNEDIRIPWDKNATYQIIFQ